MKHLKSRTFPMIRLEPVVQVFCKKGAIRTFAKFTGERRSVRPQ